MAIKVGFILLSNSRTPIASTRIAALNMFPFLISAGFEPAIIFEPAQGDETPDLRGQASGIIAAGFKVVVFQKVHGASVEALVRELHAASIKTVYAVCDMVEPGVARLVDATVVVTDYLKSLYPVSLHEKIHVVHDGIEQPDITKNDWGMHRGSRTKPLHAVLVTSSHLDWLPVLNTLPPWLRVTVIGRYAPNHAFTRRLQEARWAINRQETVAEKARCLRFLTSRQIKRVAWAPETVHAEMRNADIGIIPVDTGIEAEKSQSFPAWKVKSENRLSMKMSIGLPVIATEIPAYTSVIEHGVSGYFAHNKNEWFGALDALRDPATREQVGSRGRNAVKDRFSMAEQARLFIHVLNAVTHGLPAAVAS